ncbi:MAG TPA: DinB family protein [Anaerolineales bacterium]
MIIHVQESRRSLLDLLERTRAETRALLSVLDPERAVHDDERAWRVRDILGHLAVWNLEAARSLGAYADGEEYICVGSRSGYYDYNGPAAQERRGWSLDEVWAEYEASHDQLRHAVETLPAGKWDGEMVFPWSERGTASQLIQRMMKHEKTDHCELVIKAIAK